MKEEKTTASKVNNSSLPSAPDGAKSVPYSKFLIEKNAKNKAYYFILSNGLLGRFTKFCENYDSDDPFRDCVDYLLSERYEGKV
jgi:hypothetical protein